ncbi:hypothetical protein BD626DRAFT_398678 [Schizophyllum amplum]|uniref:Uncharacterized protein n=1 Tax=Schizophyllum amplum TaxID=97359 RepID=A0A550CKT4_9AGAR|nr:hypothetical protein BD626DRAFT_398678 [Auriculariopsis ampla]
MASPALPLEVVDYIIEIIATRHPVGHSAIIDALYALSLTCWTVRRLVLRAYLRDVAVSTRRHWEALSSLALSVENHHHYFDRSGGFGWTRTLSIPSTSIAPSTAIRLSSLTRLRQLSLEFSKEGLSTQHTRLRLIVNNLTARMLNGAYDKLTALTLTSMPRIDVSMLLLISKHFPLLVDLYISCTERLEDAWWSFVDSASCTIHSPIPHVFADVEHLAIAFSEALKPLAHLTYLHLGVYLSDEDMLCDHNDDNHMCGAEDQDDCISGVSACPFCRAYAEGVHHRESHASLLFAQNLKALRCIGWSSLFRRSVGPSCLANTDSCTPSRHAVRPTIDRLSSVFWLDRKEDGRIRACYHSQ